MSASQFSGPVRSGTVKDGSLSTTGYNMGTVLLAQNASASPITGSATNVPWAVLPGGSQIQNFFVNVLTSAGTTISTLDIGTATSGAEYITLCSTVDLGRLDLQAYLVTTGVSKYAIPVSTDTTLTYRFVNSTLATGGSVILTVLYTQEFAPSQVM